LPARASALHEQRPEVALGHQGIVRATEQSDFVGRRGAAAGEGVIVVVLEEIAGFAAAVAVVGDEGAAHGVVLANDAADLGGDVARAGLRRRGPAPGSGRPGEVLLHLLVDQEVEGQLEDRGKIAARDAMTRQLPRALQLVVELPARGELELVALRRQWRELRA
jgi:hypothetical protein